MDEWWMCRSHQQSNFRYIKIPKQNKGVLKTNGFQTNAVIAPQTYGRQARPVQQYLNVMHSLYPVFLHFKMKLLSTFHLRRVHSVFTSFESFKSMLCEISTLHFSFMLVTTL